MYACLIKYKFKYATFNRINLITVFNCVHTELNVGRAPTRDEINMRTFVCVC